MSNLYELPERSDPLEEASQWLARLDRGLDAAGQEALRQWLGADPANPSKLMEVTRIWDKADTLTQLAELFPKPLHASPGPSRKAWLGIATAAAVLLAVLAGLWSQIEKPGVHQRPPGQVFQTALGQISTVALPDGSRLMLNTDSRVRVNFTARRRAVMLERGELYVQVAHDRSRPLSVQIGDRIVQATGTAFNVKITDDQRIELIVTEGKVVVGVANRNATEPVLAAESGKSPAPLMTVSAGERAVLKNESVGTRAAQSLQPVEIEVRLSWRGGNLVFRGESLAQALAEIERYTPVEFVIQDDELKKVRIVGVFKAGDVEGLLNTLRQNFDIAYERVGDKQVILTSRSAAH